MNEETQILTRWVDPTIDDFKIALEEANKQIEEDNKEIERLNNIINELEERIVMKTNSDFIDTKVKDVCCELYQILQELKGDSSNDK